MPSSKKQRGRQRKKAAANKAAVWRSIVDCTEEQERDHDIDHDRLIMEQNVGMMQSLRRGEMEETLTVLDYFGELEYDADFDHAREQFIDIGLVDVVLSLLKRCESSEFQDIVKDAEVPISCPSKWLGILVNISGCDVLSDDILLSIRMQIAREFGPVVKCMCRTARKFFHNTEYWYLVFFGPVVHKFSQAHCVFKGGYSYLAEAQRVN